EVLEVAPQLLARLVAEGLVPHDEAEHARRLRAQEASNARHAGPRRLEGELAGYFDAFAVHELEGRAGGIVDAHAELLGTLEATAPDLDEGVTVRAALHGRAR